MLEEFNKVVVGFTDNLSLFRKRFPDRKGKNTLTLTTLAKELVDASVTNAHDALFDVLLLVKLVHKFLTYN